ncbi:haloacid dehalogenase type II [Spongisporangium articulatum]|uniref:Haloacid dehalogenase type II n=1 Tax=Spongisporangium articulatum TaxID=3362603 RepID=A0ABW8ASK3_9ACTN
MSITTLAFDVLGTVLDEDAGMRAACTALAPGRVEELFTSWNRARSARARAMAAGEAAYTPGAATDLAALRTALADLALEPAEEDVRAAGRFGHRLAPFPDSPPAFERLFRHYRLVTLTTAGLAQATDMSFASGLRWHMMLSCELVGANKPDPRTYRFLLERLELDPAEVLFVAAHEYDVEAAATFGMRTAFVDRVGLPADDLDRLAERFTYVTPDLQALADRLLPPPPVAR